jgi:hypothetical protein
MREKYYWLVADKPNEQEMFYHAFGAMRDGEMVALAPCA